TCLKTIQQVGWVEDVELSPDGRWLATAMSPGQVIVHDTTSWKPELSFFVLTESVNGLAWSKDGKLLALACASGQIHVWNVVERRRMQMIDAHKGEANDVVFTPDGKEVLSCGDDNLAKRWDVGSGKLRGTYKGHQREVEQIALSPDGRLLATASSDESFVVWDVAAGKIVNSFSGDMDRVVCVAFSTNGQLVAAGDIKGDLCVMDVKTGETRRLANQVDGIEALTFLSRNRWLATTDRGGAIQLHPVSDEPSNGQIQHPRWVAHEGEAIALTATRDGNGLISGGKDGTIRVWRPQLDKARWALYRATYNDDIAIRADKWLYRAGHKIEVWDLDTRHLVDAFATVDTKWKCISISADGRFLAAFRVGELALFDLDSRRCVDQWPVPSHFSPYRLAISPDGNDLAFVEYTERNSVFLYRRGSNRNPRLLPARQCNCLMFSPDGRWLAAGQLDTLRLFDLQNELTFRSFIGHSGGLSGVAFTPDSRHLATVSGDRLLKLWNIETGKEVYSIAAHRDAVWSVAISPDGRTIATAGRDNLIKLWHTATGQPLGELPQERWSFGKIIFSSDGRKLVGRSGAEIVVYDASNAEFQEPESTSSDERPLFTGLGDLLGGPFRGRAEGVSANGRFVVGHSYVGDDQYNPFVWSAETGMLGYDVDR
ncbi:MAG: hypothetical protein KDA84_20075, partial [Planctomycetaceae bacterium]|nr:hypothetical protein [Planctomycetaceae bacterium]